jgi:hypothetical protein
MTSVKKWFTGGQFKELLTTLSMAGFLCCGQMASGREISLSYKCKHSYSKGGNGVCHLLWIRENCLLNGLMTPT